ncbi:PAS domain S-box protein [Mucilaginibacter daejeonensis]|uniref:PAS domain S-box protein n=1 Tax=Mucilaginibacter daejeonensis TaxID=398049 RepID=UPI001D173CE9|nr:PAS domain S-box protein [Mucilaginibacter daejeonensis]UEG51565.1 PAS domain S-box protein [Mucilaginibacter daejeonensis]
MRSGALRIALIYTFLGVIWIALSDELLAFLGKEMSARTMFLISSSKGIIFVLLTGLLIWKLVHDHTLRLSEREKQYRDMYQGNPLPMWIYDIKTLRIVSVNRSAIENYGYTEEQFLSMTILDIRPEEFREVVKARVASVSTEVRRSGAWVHRKANGTLTYVNVSSQKVNYNNEMHVMVIAQDIDAHVTFEQRLKKLNLDLREKQIKLSETQKIAKVAGWEFYPAEMEMVWSEELYTLTGHQPVDKADVFKFYLQMVHPDDRADVEHALDQAIANAGELDITHRIIDGVGRVRYVRQMARSEQMVDVSIKMTGTMQDITDLTELELEHNRIKYTLEDTLNTLNDAFFTLDHDLVITKVNPRFEEETGMKKADIVGKRFAEVINGSIESGTLGRFKKVLDERRSTKFEVKSVALGKWLCVSAYPTQEGVLAYFEDITEEKQKDIRLKEALERYDIVSKATNDVIYDHDIRNDHIIYNTSLSQLVNYDKNSIAHDLKWWRSLIHPDDVGRVVKSQEKVLANKETNWWCEYRIHRGDGTYKYVYDQGYFIYDEHQEPIRLIGAIKDIDDLKRSDEENKRLAEIITKVNNMVVVMDTDNRITWVNKAFEDHIQRKLDDLAGFKTIDILRSMQVSEEALNVIAERKSRFESFMIQVQHRLPDQRQQWLEIEYTPLFKNDGTHAGYIAVYQNITERKEKEEHVIHQNKTLQEIAWLSSHEVRRPVASILGLIHLAKDANSVQEKEEIMGMINVCAEELDKIVHVITDRVNEESDLATSKE